MQPEPESLRRLGWGAVLVSIGLVLNGCSSGDNEPTAPTTPVDQGITPTAGCSDGVLQHGALFRVCFPAQWNGDLVLYAHGYVAPKEPLSLPNDSFEGQSISSTVTGLGYGYGTTSYRANGLVAPDGVDDLLELADTIDSRYRPDPARTVVVGFSEGGLAGILAVEQHPDRFAGALTGCGPIGDFQAQLNYIGDFRVVFDFFFPGLIPGSAVDIPQSVQDQWETVYVPAIVVAFALRPDEARQLMAVTGAPTAGSDLRSLAETAVGVLWYNVFGTADAQARLGGQPFDNSATVYAGSSNDTDLNAGVQRFTRDPATLTGIERFQTSGALRVPVVNLHTTGDPIIPFSQSTLYQSKLAAAATSSFFTQTDVERYGHCSFQRDELLSAFHSLEGKLAPASSVAALSR
jgi:pimeloyl-ACP methyl ester carboxylesterase